MARKKGRYECCTRVEGREGGHPACPLLRPVTCDLLSKMSQMLKDVEEDGDCFGVGSRSPPLYPTLPSAWTSDVDLAGLGRVAS